MSTAPRPIPGHPDHTIDSDGRVRRAVRAHGRVYQALVPCVDGVVKLIGKSSATAALVSTLMEHVWPELCGLAEPGDDDEESLNFSDGDPMDSDS